MKGRFVKLAAIVILAAAAALAGDAHAQEQAQDDEPLSISIGARLFASGWEGENEISSTTRFDADDGGALGFRVVLQKGRFYGGASFQGGEYGFDNGSPDRVGGAPLPGGAVTDSRATIKRGEVDLLFGYYFWDRVSLFVDIKHVNNEWTDENYSLKYGGLGAGVSGFWPLNEQWTAFGTFGIVPLNIEAGNTEIGDGLGSAIEAGLVYRLLERTTLVFSLRNQHQEYDFDNGARQSHDIGGLAIGINHRFEAN